MGTHLRVLSESYPMNTNMAVFKISFTHFCVLVPIMKVIASAVIRLKHSGKDKDGGSKYAKPVTAVTQICWFRISF